MKAVRVAVAGWALAGVALAHSSAMADGEPVTVIELFTSQSCYSCPPAEAYLGELVAEDGILALEYHVDYWDQLTYGRHGRWKDVFSSPQMTQRQRAYNVRIRNTGGVYTPQMVIDGRAEAVGSRRREVRSRIAEVRRDDAPRVPVAVAARDGGGVTVSLGNVPDARADVWLVTFIREHVTKVLRGENHGKTLTNHHVVREVHHIGAWDGTDRVIDVSGLTIEEGQGCAVLVQSDAVGPVLGAAYCPAGVEAAS